MWYLGLNGVNCKAAGFGHLRPILRHQNRGALRAGNLRAVSHATPLAAQSPAHDLVESFEPSLQIVFFEVGDLYQRT